MRFWTPEKLSELSRMANVEKLSHVDILRFSELVGFTTSHRRDRLGQVVEAISKGGAPL